MKKEKSHIHFLAHSDLKFTEDVEGSDFIGRGAYGSVFTGKLGGVIVAIKRMHSLPHFKGHDFDMRWEILGEIEKYFKIGKHQNVVECLGLAEKNDIFYLVMEYFPLGDLHSIIKNQMERPDSKETIRFSLEDKLRISLGISEAIQFCHSKGLIHRDIRPSNVLLEQVFREVGSLVYNARVCDFGLSCANNSFADPLGAPYFVPPEYFESGGKKITITKASDVYSLGMTIWCIFAERIRPTGNTSEFNLSLKGDDKITRNLAKLVNQCCKTTASERCGVGGVIRGLKECLSIILSYGDSYLISGQNVSTRRWVTDEEVGAVEINELKRIVKAERAMQRNVKSREDFAVRRNSKLAVEMEGLTIDSIVTDAHGNVFPIFYEAVSKITPNRSFERVKKVIKTVPIHRNLMRIHHIFQRVVDGDQITAHTRNCYVLPISFLTCVKNKDVKEKMKAVSMVTMDDRSVQFFLFLRDVLCGLSALRAKHLMHCNLYDSIYAIEERWGSRYVIWNWHTHCLNFSDESEPRNFEMSRSIIEKSVLDSIPRRSYVGVPPEVFKSFPEESSAIMMEDHKIKSREWRKHLAKRTEDFVASRTEDFVASRTEDFVASRTEDFVASRILSYYGINNPIRHSYKPNYSSTAGIDFVSMYTSPAVGFDVGTISEESGEEDENADEESGEEYIGEDEEDLNLDDVEEDYAFGDDEESGTEDEEGGSISDDEGGSGDEEGGIEDDEGGSISDDEGGSGDEEGGTEDEEGGTEDEESGSGDEDDYYGFTRYDDRMGTNESGERINNNEIGDGSEGEVSEESSDGFEPMETTTKFGKFDVYSLGILCRKIFSGYRPPSSSHASKVIKIIDRMTKEDYNERISFGELKEIVYNEVYPMRRKRERLHFLYERYSMASVSALFYTSVLKTEHVFDNGPLTPYNPFSVKSYWNDNTQQEIDIFDQVLRFSSLNNESRRKRVMKTKTASYPNTYIESGEVSADMLLEMMLEGDFDSNDLDTVMEQANVNHLAALWALKKGDGDVVDAVIYLHGGE